MLCTKRIVFCLLALVFINSALLFRLLELNIFLQIPVLACLAAAFIYYNIRPGTDLVSPEGQKQLVAGYELLAASGFIFTCQILIYLYVINAPALHVPTWVLALNGVISALLIYVILLNGFIRVFAASKQLGIILRTVLLFLWWVPVLNIVLIGVTCGTVKAEYKFLYKKRLLNGERKGKEICKTQYPILLVHGIFFRDWKHFNYWGRIPAELTGNGAVVAYGNHDSSASVEQSAHELKARILAVLEETGAEKVNIVAHSKGGIDSRYAISCLGMDEVVASLTTINTPHRGCRFVGKILQKAPKRLISTVGKHYNSIFTKLGDGQCDFYGGVSELTAEKCAELNEKLPDKDGVLYQSAGSKMSSGSRAILPLKVGYAVIKPLDGDNDGLVSTESMKWGNLLGVAEPAGKKGISHGDMIDLTRKNIKGFDVCEFYVQLISGLKERGL